MAFQVDAIGAFQFATIARRGSTSSHKRLLLGFCGERSGTSQKQNLAGASRSAPSSRRTVEMAFHTLT
jgi:hypothetical protein